jgi:hypothetical protein
MGAHAPIEFRRSAAHYSRRSLHAGVGLGEQGPAPAPPAGAASPGGQAAGRLGGLHQGSAMSGRFAARAAES